MEKIDRLGWAAGLSIQAYGLRIGVRVSKAEALDDVLAVLPPGWEPSCTPIVDRLYSLRMGGPTHGNRVRNYHILFMGLQKLARTHDLGEALDALESDLQIHVAEFAHNRIFVHAGVVGWRGQAILLPGPTCAGKTSLVTALLRAGATYYSDEYAVLDGRGLVHPYARRLSLRQPGGERNHRCGPEEFGSHSGEKPLPVGLIALTSFGAGAVWQPKTLSPGKAAMELLLNTIPAQTDPEAVLSTLRRVVAFAPTIRSPRGEADDIVEDLLRIIERGDYSSNQRLAAA